MVLAVAAAALAAVPVGATAAPTTTVQRTIRDCDGDNLLEFVGGEPYVDLATGDFTGDDGCDSDVSGVHPHLSQNASLLNFLQLSDFQIADEESPGRVEFIDTTQRAPGLNPLSAAYRPQESLSTQVTEAMVRQARNTTSPVTGARLDLTMLTGDNADSQQYNETRWFIDIMDGTTGAGDPDPEMDVTADGQPVPGHKIVPDSGITTQIGTCGASANGYQDNGLLYDGVRGGGRPGQDTGYYEPDSSAGAQDDGDGYSPDRERNQAEVPGPFADVTVRDFPTLFEAAQQPFEAVGIGMPWYSAFGNHDALVQGNSSTAYFGPSAAIPPPNSETVNPSFDAIVRGCLKPSKLPAGVSIEQYLDDPSAFLAATDPAVVPPDPRRCHVAKDDPTAAAFPCDTGGWIEQHSRTTGLPVGHGFEPFAADGQAGGGRPAVARTNHDGYYSFVPRPGFRFVVLDTITDECGLEEICSEGSIDNPQFEWLDGELDDAAAAGQYVIVFSHHTERTIRLPSTDPGEQPIHFGERVDQKDGQPVAPESLPPQETLEDLLCRHANVLAHVDGHEHQNYVLHHECQDSDGQNPYWEVSTAAHIDWPQQSRMIELVRTGGSMSMVLTMLDHDGPAYPGGPKPDLVASGDAGQQPLRLASIAREIGYNDYQGSRGASGDRTDRNVVVPLDKPPPATAGG